MSLTLGTGFVVLGDGLFGSLAALCLSRVGPTTLIGRGCLPGSAVESVPLSGIQSLRGLGLSLAPRVLTRQRSARWGPEEEPESAENGLLAPCWHVDRQELVAALWERLARGDLPVRRLVRNLSSNQVEALRRGAWGCVDATGRRALSATAVRRFQAVALVGTVRSSAPDPGLRLQMFPHGYAYRLGDGVSTTLGICGALPPGVEARRALWRQVCDDWIGEGMPGSPPGRLSTRLCGVQWSLGPGRWQALPVGEAALARDPLSSLGIAAGLADLWAALSVVEFPQDTPLLEQRRAEQRREHLRVLQEMIARGRFCRSAYWLGYQRFLVRALAAQPPTVPVALRGTRLVRA